MSRHVEEVMEEARQRVSDMLAVATVLGIVVGPEEIRRAALVPVSEVAERFVVMLAACARENLEAIARVLAGLGDDETIALIMTGIDSIKARRPRRYRRP